MKRIGKAVFALCGMLVALGGCAVYEPYAAYPAYPGAVVVAPPPPPVYGSVRVYEGGGWGRGPGWGHGRGHGWGHGYYR